MDSALPAFARLGVTLRFHIIILAAITGFATPAPTAAPGALACGKIV